MEAFIDPSFLVSVSPPSISFSTPQPLQVPVSPPLPNRRVRLLCETTHHVVDVSHLNSPGLRQLFHDTQTHTQYLIHLRDQSQLSHILSHVLSTSLKIPQSYHEYIIHSALIQLQILEASLATFYELHIELDCHKFYCPDVNAYSLWATTTRLQGSQIDATYPIDDGMRPASELAIKSMVARKKMKKDEETEGSGCSICLEEFVEGSVTGCMPCSHMFHEECITSWLRRSHCCCRFELPPSIMSD